MQPVYFTFKLYEKTEKRKSRKERFVDYIAIGLCCGY